MNSRLYLVLIAPLTAGCMVSSLQPIYTPADVVYRQESVGMWREEKSTNILLDISREREDGDTYLIVYREPEAKKDLHMRAHLCMIGERIYLDAEPVMDEAAIEETLPEMLLRRPIHLFDMVELRDDVLRLREMSWAWAQERRENGRLWVDHIGDGDSTLLTADTERVQRFLRR